MENSPCRTYIGYPPSDFCPVSYPRRSAKSVPAKKRYLYPHSLPSLSKGSASSFGTNPIPKIFSIKGSMRSEVATFHIGFEIDFMLDKKNSCTSHRQRSLCPGRPMDIFSTSFNLSAALHSASYWFPPTKYLPEASIFSYRAAPGNLTGAESLPDPVCRLKVFDDFRRGALWILIGSSDKSVRKAYRAFQQKEMQRRFRSSDSTVPPSSAPACPISSWASTRCLYATSHMGIEPLPFSGQADPPCLTDNSLQFSGPPKASLPVSHWAGCFQEQRRSGDVSVFCHIIKNFSL